MVDEMLLLVFTGLSAIATAMAAIAAAKSYSVAKSVSAFQTRRLLDDQWQTLNAIVLQDADSMKAVQILRTGAPGDLDEGRQEIISIMVLNIIQNYYTAVDRGFVTECAVQASLDNAAKFLARRQEMALKLAKERGFDRDFSAKLQKLFAKIQQA